MKKNFGLLLGAAMIAVSLYGLVIAPNIKKGKVDEQTANIKETIEQAQQQTPETIIESEIETEETVEKIPVFDIDFCKKLFNYKTATEEEYLESSSVGLIEIPESDIEVAVRYGTKYESNIDSAAGLTEFSTSERLYILGHNYKNGTVFHNLVDTKVGEEVELTLVRDAQTTKYCFSVVFTKQYTETEYEADNFELITNNSDYKGEYDLVLVTCNHYSNGTKGRQVVLCQLLGD